MKEMIAVLGSLLGLVVGSFLNVVIFRYGSKTDFFYSGWSKCPKCEHRLYFFDLIPVLSYLFLRGRCRYCHKIISWRYPLIELVAAIGTALLFQFNFDNPLVLVGLLLSFWPGIVVFFIDYDQMEIAFGPLLVLLGGAALYRAGLDFSLSNLELSLVGALIGSFIVGLIIVLTKGRGMGQGDIWVMAVLGFLVGWPLALVAFLFAVILGAVCGLGLIALKLKSIKDAVPFAPFLLLGAALAMIWGEQLLHWYLFI